MCTCMLSESVSHCMMCIYIATALQCKLHSFSDGENSSGLVTCIAGRFDDPVSSAFIVQPLKEFEFHSF